MRVKLRLSTHKQIILAPTLVEVLTHWSQLVLSLLSDSLKVETYQQESEDQISGK